MRVISSTWLFAATATAGASLSSIASLRCTGDVLPTPTYNLTRALFSICAGEIIDAPIQAIFDTVIDFGRYREWNSFIVEASSPLGVQGPEGVHLEMPVVLTSVGVGPFANTSTTVAMSVLAPDVEDEDGLGRIRAVAAWRSAPGFARYAMPVEHPYLLTDLGNGSVRVISYETFYLPGAALVWFMKDTLQEKFLVQNRDLKKYSEGGL